MAEAKSDQVYEGLQVGTGQLKWTASPADLVFGSNSHLRAISEFYGCSDSTPAFVRTLSRRGTR